MSKIKETSEDVFQVKFFIKRPMLTSFMSEKDSVILIDEIDKADEEVESFLLQALGEKQITVNDLGTFHLHNDLLVIMTSNSQRQLLDETKDRCLYLYIDYPSFEREVEIVNHTPQKLLPHWLKMWLRLYRKSGNWTWLKHLLSGPETALLGVMFAGAGIFEMLLGTEEVWSAVFMPTMTTKTYEEQIHDWPSWFIW